MLNIDEINNTIAELENGSTTFDNCNRLASLYIVRDKLTSHVVDTTEQELNDILSQYRSYCNIKRKFQLHEVSEQIMLDAMQELCREIKEFVQILYSSTDT